jgi:CHAT domain-containing protein
VLLVSDEPWIPWEIVKPYDDSDPEDVVDDDFLCCRFQLTRWLAGGRGPAGVIEVTKLAAIEAGSPPNLQPLVHAEDERRFLSELVERHPGVADLSLDQTTHPRVTELLSEHDLDVLHFVGHGELDAKDANVSSFWLHDGRTLRPRDFRGGIQTRLRSRRPLVFFNACQVARQSWSLTRLGGWAQRFVHDCGCGALVGPQWTVCDEDAHAFAKAFYEAPERGETFGQATCEARRAVSSPEGRLAFKVYAHPNGRLRLGFAPGPRESSGGA